MLIITDVETLYRIPDNELNKLTSKDRVVIFSRVGSQMPMSKFQALASIKAKMEIIESPTEIDSMDELDQRLYTGYQYGAHAATAKPQEPVKIYSSLLDKIAKSGAKVPAIIKSMGKIQICGVEDKKGSRSAGNKKAAAPKKNVKAASTPAPSTPVQKDEVKPAKASSSKKAATAPAKADKKSKSSPLIEKMCSLGLSDMKTKLSKNEEQLVKAIKNATDAEIGYKFQLKMVFGEDDSVKIWDKTSKAFEQLKKLI